ncbi:hypothetical protein EON79_03165 [bacterium]|nr:MAG: hypothetical protein EON79_03165 [bacterium]
MSIAMLLLLTPMGPADIVIDRYDKWLASKPSFMVKGGATSPGMPKPVDFEIRIQRPASIWFHAQLGKTDYRLSKTETGQVETESGQKAYDETGPAPGLRMYESKISGLPKFAFPSWLTMPTIKGMFQGDLKLEKAQVGGRSVDLVSIERKEEGGAFAAWGWFDAQGAPVRFRILSRSPMGVSDTTWNFASFATLPKGDPFALTIPGDHVPYRLDDSSFPSHVGDPVRLGTWQRGGSTVDLDEEAKGTTLVAVLSPGTPPSDRVAPSLAALERDGLKVLRLSDEEKSASMIHDPTGRLLQSFGLPGTPYLMLLKDGRIAGLWFGADADAKSLVGEVQTVAKG